MSVIKLKPLTYVPHVLNFAKILQGQTERLTEMAAVIGP